MIEGVEQRRCPRRPILDDPDFYSEVFWLYRQSRSGYLMEDGGLNDQPAMMMKCFRIIDRAIGQVEGFRKEQEERRRKREAIKGKRRPARGGR